MTQAFGALRRGEIILALSIAAYTAWFTYLSYSRWAVMQSEAGDLGSIDSAAYNTAHGAFMLSTGLKVQNMWADHFTPILLPLTTYYLFDDGFLFIFLWQAISVALAAVPLYLIASDILGRRTALIIALAYLANGHLHAALLFDYHEAAHVGLFALSAVYMALKKRWGWYALFCALLLACREDAALILICVGLWLALFEKEWRRGAWTTFLAALYFVILMKAVFPHLKTLSVEARYEDAYMYFENYAWLGKTPAEAVTNMVTHPVEMARKILAPERTGEWAKLAAQYAGMPFLSPGGLLIMAPTTLSLFLNDYRARYLFFWHYPMLAIPFWALGFVWGVANLQRAMRAAGIGAWPIDKLNRIFRPMMTLAGLAAAVYLVVGALFLIHGPFDSTFAGVRVHLSDVEKPVLIVFVSSLIFIFFSPANRLMGVDLAERTAATLALYLLLGSFWLAIDKGGVPLLSQEYRQYFDERMVERSDRARRTLAALPRHYSGVVSQGIYTLALHNPNVFLFRGFDKYPFGARLVDYLVFDMDPPIAEPFRKNVIRWHVNHLLSGEKNYGVAKHEDGLVIFKRGATKTQDYQLFKETGLTFGVDFMGKSVGEELEDPTSAHGWIRRVSPQLQNRGYLAYGPYLALRRGDYSVTCRLRANAITADDIGHMDVSHDEGKVIIASRPLAAADFPEKGKWRELTLPFTIDAEKTENIEFRIEYHGGATLYFDECRVNMTQAAFDAALEAEYAAEGPVVPPLRRP
ncbi:MAG: DUF2079 domain-containing protein [Nitrospinota bacterium]|nr:DUF2079 domain-containing protein [Nitrospinota bacterium]